MKKKIFAFGAAVLLVAALAALAGCKTEEELSDRDKAVELLKEVLAIAEEAKETEDDAAPGEYYFTNGMKTLSISLIDGDLTNVENYESSYDTWLAEVGGKLPTKEELLDHYGLAQK
jgi:hypothetical protein